MTPLRFLLLLSCFIALPIVLTCVSLFSAHGRAPEPFEAGYSARSTGLRALLSFSTPSSLFPPSAIISLTYDNATFFLARPAAFGPGLPSKGLSGQLWVGRGFGDDSLLKGEDLKTAGWELGCSDVPGWAEDDKTRSEKTAKVAIEAINAEAADSPIEETSSDSGIALDTSAGESGMDDGTDDHLHRPLPDSNPARSGKLGEPADAGVQDRRIQPEHADIESLQESADIAGKIVMLSRGGCGFLEKVKWAQRRGGIGLIVGDNERGGQLTIMYAKGDTSNVSIPALFTSYTSAHLLSSLVPLETVVEVDEVIKQTTAGKDSKDLNKKNRAGPKVDGPIFTSTTTSTISTVQRPTIVPAKNTRQIAVDGRKGWLQNVLSVVGIDESFAHSEDSRRPPSSGNIDWVLLEDWDEEDIKTASTKMVVQPTNSATLTKSALDPDATSKRPDNDFVIGVQDWRDTALLGESSEQRLDVHDSKGNNAGNNEPTQSTQAHIPTATPLKGGSITPGSGEYQDENKAHSSRPGSSKPGVTPHSDDGSKWFPFGKTHNDRQPQGLPAVGHDKQSRPQAVKHASSTSHGVEDEPQGLWVTLTPTSVSTSPFLDTLLVLVVSPLVTLTVVYALLLLRSRIRRRRWRAPKSVVERLPVRTYHTISTTSSTTSSELSTPNTSSPTTPLLQSTSHDVSRRSRPRSQTTTGVFPANSQHPTRVSSHSRSPPDRQAQLTTKYKPYSGRQVECVVCLEEYVDGESRVMSLPCGHEFHADCITPWLVNRRRTCPICKGDVVRSLARTSSGRGRASDHRGPDEQTSDDVQDRVAQTVNSEPSSAIPIPAREDDIMDEDVERGEGLDAPPTRQPERQSAWRNIVNASVSRLSGDTVWRQTPNDRSR